MLTHILSSPKQSNKAEHILTNLFVCFVCFCPCMLFLGVFSLPDLGPPKGIRFSDVTDTSTTVHWVVPRARVDSYRVTYVPAHGGQSPYV